MYVCQLPFEDNVHSNNNVQWAQGKAGEDRIHVVLSEEHGWSFVGIYKASMVLMPLSF
jgi:hypothetical protein